MRSWRGAVLGAMATLAAVGLGPARPAMAVSTPEIGMEMLILIPRGHHLSAFEQIMQAPHAQASLSIGMLTGARKVRVVGASLLHRSGATVVVRPTSQHPAVRYRVPWNGHSVALRLQPPDRIGALVVLVEPSLRLPAVLNPTLGAVGQGRIPGVPNSPIFDEYGASRLSSDRPIPLVLEHVLAGVGGSQGNHPAVAHLFELMAGLASLAAVYAALYWRPVAPPTGPVDRALQDLAATLAAFRRGELDADRYRSRRRELLEQIRSGGRWG